ncbi:hypothetical protein CNMCM8980_005372 [Aspergillus fumigatiaffinis]|nr:hypothetical protein CNMCM8980_005372 [Aspergillus fumigatiaffinis]
MDNLTESMRNTHLDDGPEELEQLLFRLQGDSGLAEKALDNIPRYLFRVVSPRSDGETNGIWACSESAYRKRSSSSEDIFFLLDNKKRTTIARTLNVHLRWWPKEGLEDNFVSWTSSLLFAIQYIYYRHLSSKDGSNLEDILLYVIDTKRFPVGTFVRDLDLIDAFHKFDDHGKTNLENLQSLRIKSSYYFGEYLSQGSLKIRGKCQVVSAKVLFDDDRLHRIQPEFAKRSDILEKGKAEWANEVVRLRGIIWPVDKGKRLPTAEILDRLRAVGEIVAHFEPEWRFALAIYFTALTGCESVTDDQETTNDNVIFAYFRSESFNGNGEIRLNDRDPILVRKMLEFLYTGDYTYEASSARGSFDAENISGELSHTYLDKDLQADTGTEVFRDVQGETSSAKPRTGQAFFHARMYAQGAYFQIEGLKIRAKEYFQESFMKFPDRESFTSAVFEVYDSTEGHDRGLRDLVVQMTTDNLLLLRANDNPILDGTFLEVVPNFMLEICVSAVDRCAKHQREYGGWGY